MRRLFVSTDVLSRHCFRCNMFFFIILIVRCLLLIRCFFITPMFWLSCSVFRTRRVSGCGQLWRRLFRSLSTDDTSLDGLDPAQPRSSQRQSARSQCRRFQCADVVLQHEQTSVSTNICQFTPPHTHLNIVCPFSHSLCAEVVFNRGSTPPPENFLTHPSPSGDVKRSYT